MSEEIIQVNPQIFYSMTEAGQLLGITGDSFKVLTKRYAKYLESNVLKIKHHCKVSNNHRLMTVISQVGLDTIIKLKDSSRSNQHEKKILGDQGFRDYKASKIDNSDVDDIFNTFFGKQSKTISQILPSQQVIIDMTNLIKELTQELRTMRQERVRLPMPQENSPYRLVSKKEKEELTSMCKAIVFRRLGVEYGDSYDNNEFEREIIALRRDMNFQLGRSKVGDYTKKDFEEAKDWLKKFN